MFVAPVMREARAGACICLRRLPVLRVTVYGRHRQVPERAVLAPAAPASVLHYGHALLSLACVPIVAALGTALQRCQNEAMAFMRRLPSVVT